MLQPYIDTKDFQPFFWQVSPSSLCHNSLKTDRCVTAILKYAVNQSSEYKDAHYVRIEVLHLSVFRLLFVSSKSLPCFLSFFFLATLHTFSI